MSPTTGATRRSTRLNASTSETPAQVPADPSSVYIEPEITSQQNSVPSGQDGPGGTEMPPPRAPVQRLDSLTRPSSSTPITPTAKPALKYKPKNIRRSKEEREAAELAEAERMRQRQAAAGNAASVSSRGNWPGRGGSRGRGSYGRGGRGGRDIVSTASGPFGSGSVTTCKSYWQVNISWIIQGELTSFFSRKEAGYHSRAGEVHVLYYRSQVYNEVSSCQA